MSFGEKVKKEMELPLTIKLDIGKLRELYSDIFVFQDQLRRQQLFIDADGIENKKERIKEIQKVMDSYFIRTKSLEDVSDVKIEELFHALRNFYKSELDNLNHILKAKYGIEIIDDYKY